VAVVRVPLSPAPVVQLVDALGAAVPLAGVPIGVTTVDGATLTGEATRLTDDRGRAVFDGLAFSGRAAGARALRFAGPGAPLVSAAIEVQAGPPARLVGISALAQVAAPLAAVTEPPAVRVEDLDANPAAGVTVEFAVSAGGGTLGGATAVSDAAGLARVERWTLGAGGDQAVVASIPLAPLVAPLAFAATAAPPPPRYEIELRFVTPASAGQQSAFERARRRIEAVVVGDLPDVTLPAGSACAGEPLGASLVDDLLIVVRVEPIDGPGLILGQAGPCLVRVAGLPVAGIMMFDEADLGRLEADGRLDSVILHEMLHVVGFGVLWSRDGLVAGAGGADPVFVGPRAREQFAVHDGGVETAGGVPVEGSGGVGTAGAHWRETVFGSELMTGWLTGVSQPLGGATAGSLADLGYEVDVAAADDFRIGGLPRALAGPPLPALSLEGDVLPLAPVEVDAAGVPVAR
jgi:hypothetical protein